MTLTHCFDKPPHPLIKKLFFIDVAESHGKCTLVRSLADLAHLLPMRQDCQGLPRRGYSLDGTFWTIRLCCWRQPTTRHSDWFNACVLFKTPNLYPSHGKAFCQSASSWRRLYWQRPMWHSIQKWLCFFYRYSILNQKNLSLNPAIEIEEDELGSFAKLWITMTLIINSQ